MGLRGPSRALLFITLSFVGEALSVKGAPPMPCGVVLAWADLLGAARTGVLRPRCPLS